MELTVNVYGEDNKSIVKSYVCQDFKLKTGVCEDLLQAIDIEKLIENGLDEAELGQTVLKLVGTSYWKLRPFILQTFHGMTEEEFANTHIDEVGRCIVQMVVYTITSIFGIMGATDAKNRRAVVGKK